MKRRDSLPGRQQGAALLLLMLILMTAGTFVLLPESFGVSVTVQEQKSAEALGKARAALLGYAATWPDRGTGRGPGFLPCPDTDGDGRSNPPCNSVQDQVTLGRLPWRDLGTEELLDGWGEPLWYAVSSNYREAPAVAELNSDTRQYPFFSLDGGSREVAAVVLAPGAPVSGQVRPSNRPQDYLEDVNGDPAAIGTKDFRNLADHSVAGNDRVVAIGRDALMRRAERRALGQMRQLLLDYYRGCGYLPWAAPFDPAAATQEAVVGIAEGLLPVDRAAADGSATAEWDSGCAVGLTPGWLASEGWHRLIYYAASFPWLENGSGSCGACLILNGQHGIPALLVAAGRDLGTGRPSTDPGDYFEGENAVAGDEIFEYRAGDDTFNDKVTVVNLQ